MKNSNGSNIGIRARNLPAFSTVPKQTARPRVPLTITRPTVRPDKCTNVNTA